MYLIACLSYLLLGSPSLMAKPLSLDEAVTDIDNIAVETFLSDAQSQDGSNSNPISEEDTTIAEISEEQGLINAQIDDVFDSAEFLQMAQDEQLQPPLHGEQVEEMVNGKSLTNEPEDLLNELDGSDLMDYVAEDDLWKEQLTIEDEP